MKSDVIEVSNTGNQIEEVLEQTEKVAVYKNLSPKNTLHLRILAEEMMSMMRAITGDTCGTFWIEDEDGVFRLHLLVRADIDFQQREKLLSAATSGKNEAHKGVMGKIRSFFEPVDGFPVFFDPVLDGANMEMFWSLGVYQEQIRKYAEEGHSDAVEAWDELEKSVVAHIADDVKVSIKGWDVEMEIIKKMS